MMLYIHVARLDKNEREQIEQRVFSDAEFEMLRDGLQDGIDARKRGLRRAAVLTITLSAALLVLTVVTNPNPMPADLIAFMAACLASILALALGIGWVTQIALLRAQFNRIADRAYPHLTHCRLR